MLCSSKWKSSYHTKCVVGRIGQSLNTSAKSLQRGIRVSYSRYTSYVVRVNVLMQSFKQYADSSNLLRNVAGHHSGCLSLGDQLEVRARAVGPLTWLRLCIAGKRKGKQGQSMAPHCV